MASVPMAAAAAPAKHDAVLASPAAQQQQQQQRTCFNTFCKEPVKAEGPPRRRGWRLRSGEFADLCDRCLCIYEQGNFCDTFHSEVAGWRNCEACGKKVHCGCIVSLPSYVLLDAGGVDCVACARKLIGMASSPVWLAPSTAMQHPRYQTMRPPAGTPFPGHWRQASNLWNTSSVQSDLQQRLAFEFDRPNSEKFLQQQVRASAALQQHQQPHHHPPHHQQQHVAVTEKKYEERFGANGSNGSNNAPGLDPAYPFSIYHRAEGGNSNPNPNPNNTNSLPLPHAHHISSDPNIDPHVNASTYRDESGAYRKDLLGASSSSGSPMKAHFLSPTDGNTNRPPRLDVRGRSQVLPRYWPRSTGQELHPINGEGSTSVITPLFEKMLSASDAGRIGRLVLPKKCAEAYFPAISQPEGLPLTVQDACGKEWQFQFRFWPNNNSRMYVLEGVTPCIQAMQLQAGDTVTFSRIDPEGKLVMGFRKASAPGYGEPETQHLKSSNGFLTSPPPENNPNININTSSDPKESNENHQELFNNPENKSSALAYVSQEGGFVNLLSKPPPPPQMAVPVKRKGGVGGALGAKVKRLKIETEESMELKLNWEEAQSLLRAPSNAIPSVTVIDGNEFEEFEYSVPSNAVPSVTVIDGNGFEEFEEPPVVGRRTYFVTTQTGEKHQWVQCEECNKWRKVPVDALLNAKWSCSQNAWDPERASCSSPAELTVEQLAELIPYRTGVPKRSRLKHEHPSSPSPSPSIRPSDGLDTLANLAIMGESNPKSPPPDSTPHVHVQTTRHPRHRPGCTCIVCIQPPSGKGPKHKQSCVCNVCNTVRRRFRTLMLRRGEKQKNSEGLGEGGGKGQNGNNGNNGSGGVEVGGSNNSGSTTVADEGSDRRNGTVPSSSSSPLKAQIDLNIQPEKEEEISPKSAAKRIDDDDAPST